MFNNLFQGVSFKPVPRGREHLNPKPPIPDTGWKPLRKLPSLANEEVISFDLETYDPGLDKKIDTGPGWGRKDGFVVGAALAAGRHRIYIPLRHKEEAKDNFPLDEALDYLGIELGRAEQTKTGFNLMYDIGWTADMGIKVNGNLWCCQVVEKQIINTTMEIPPANDLDSVARRHLGADCGKTSDDLCRWLWNYYGNKSNPTPEQLNSMRKFIYRTPPRLCGPYAIGDVDLPLRIMPIQQEIVEREGLTTVCELENALIHVIVAMRRKGVTVNLNQAEQADAKLTIEIGDMNKRIRDIVGKPINTGSPIEVGKAFSVLGIQLPQTPGGQPCVAEKVLKRIKHPLAQMVLDIESLKKFQGTFIQGAILKSHVNGVVHGEFLPLTAITGRMSSRHPNLQNIPSRKELAKIIRSIFGPRICSASSHWRKYDYASIEARLLAHFAVGIGSDELRAEYNNSPFALGHTRDRKQDADYHNFTMAMIKRVTGMDMDRKQAKNINFACIYGGQDKKLASMLGLAEDEGGPFMEAYHNSLPYIKSTMGYVSRMVQEMGCTRTILGRRVLFDEWVPTKRREKGDPIPKPLPLEAAYHLYGDGLKRADSYKGLNYVIQGSAADLMKASMVMCYEQGIFDVIGVPSLVVHDELDFEVAEQTREVHEAFEAMVNIMETAIPFNVPVRVDGEWGMNWSDLEAIPDDVY